MQRTNTPESDNSSSEPNSDESSRPNKFTINNAKSPQRKEISMGRTIKAFSPGKKKIKANMIRTVLHFDIDGKRKQLTLPNDDDDLEDVLDKIRNIVSLHEDAQGHQVVDVKMKFNMDCCSGCLFNCFKNFLKKPVIKDNKLKARATIV